MRNLVIILFVYTTVLGVCFIIDISKIPVKYKFMLATILIAASLFSLKRLSKKMSRFENEIFGVFLVATLAISWILKDAGRGEYSLFTLFILIVFAAGVIRIAYLLRKHKNIKSKK